ncbi:putative ribonuclease H-like domain-containing protein, partial [Tanacetum coccineum]
TNEVNTTYGVSTANLSDATVYAFLANQPNGSQLVHEDLEQIHEDDLEEMDLKWQLALLNMRTRKFFQKTGRKMTINGSDTAGYNKSKVECFNCHKLGHIARGCRGPRNQDNMSRNQDSSRRTINVEEISSKAMLAINGACFDWSFMADEEVPTDMALMDFSDFEFNKSKFNLATYKRGLASVEEQLVFYKKNEVLFCEQLAVLKRDISYKDSEISVLKSELEKLKQEKESNQLKIEKFDNASKSLDKLIGSQIPDKSRKGLGFVSYNAVPPLPIGLFLPPNLDLSNSSLEEFQQPEFEGYGPKTSKNVSEDTYNEARESPDASLVEELTAIIIKEKGWNIVPRAVLMKTDLRPLNTARPVNTAHPKTTVYSARPMPKAVNTARPNSVVVNAVRANQGHLQKEDQGYVDSGCSSHMTGNMSYLSDFREFDRGYVAFGGGAKGGRITGKRTLKTVLCFVLSPDFKLADESRVLLKVPRKNNMYSVDMKNIVPKESLTCLVAKATLDESMIWHRRLVMSEFCEKKGIKREFSVARTPQQNGVAERINWTLIEASRTMLADSKVNPYTFWAEVVNTACYVQNRVLVVKPHNKTPYELFRGRTPSLSFMRPFGCHVTILNTLDHLGKFDGKSDDGFFVGTIIIVIIGEGQSKTRETWILPKDNFDATGKIVQSIPFNSFLKNASNDEPQPSSDAGKKDDEGVRKESGIDDQEGHENSAQDVNTAGTNINTANINTGSLNINTDGPTIITALLEATHADFPLVAEQNWIMSNIFTYTYPSSVQTRRMINEQGFISAVYEGKTHEDLHTCLFACFLSQEEPKKTLVDLSYGKRAIGTKWVYRNKKDERGIMIRNKARLVAQCYTQEEGIDYDDVFAPVARIESIRLFLAYASFKDFVVYQMDLKSAFLYGKIEEEVYVCQPPGFEDPEFLDKVYKVEKALYGLHQAPRAWYETLSTYLLDNGFQRGQIDKTLFIKRVKGDILLVQVYVDDIIFGSTRKEMCTEFEKIMHIRDTRAEDVDVHLCISMIGSLMYLTTSRLDIMFAVCACLRFQVTSKVSHLHAVKRIFRYLKGQPKLGLWYPKDSLFDLEAYTDSDYQTIVATSTTEAEYVAAASCCGQVLWIQNQMPDYGYNFMNTKIFIDNESTICIVKNPVFHSKTKHIEIRHHFIRDSNEKKLIQMIKIYTDQNVADLLTKATNVGRFQYLIASIGMLNL